MTGRLTTHVLDTAQGRPAAGLVIRLSRITAGETVAIITATTNADGRTDRPLLEGDGFAAGPYELLFAAGDYFRAEGLALSDPPFLDEIPIRFVLAANSGNYHVPLLLSPWSYSTYRGS